MNFLATQIINETPFISKASAPEHIPQKKSTRPLNSAQRKLYENPVKQTEKKQPKIVKTDNLLHEANNIMDPFYISEFFNDLSFDKSDISSGGCSYLGILSELLSSSSEERPEKSKSQKGSRFNRPKTSQPIVKKTERKQNWMVEKMEQNKENIAKTANLATEKKKIIEKPKKPVYQAKRGRNSPVQSEKSTQTGKAARLAEIQEQQQKQGYQGNLPKKKTLKARSFSEKAIQTSEKSLKKHNYSADKSKPQLKNPKNPPVHNYSRIYQNEKKDYGNKIIKTRPFSASPPKDFEYLEKRDSITNQRRSSKAGLSYDNNKPKFNLHFKKPPTNNKQEMNNYRLSLSEKKKRMNYELEKKREKVTLVKNQRKKKEDYYSKSREMVHQFVSEAKKRLLQRKKTEKIDWDEKLYSYSAHKAQKQQELFKKKNKVIEIKAKKLEKKKSQVQEKRYQDLQKINQYVVENVFHDRKIDKKSHQPDHLLARDDEYQKNAFPSRSKQDFLQNKGNNNMNKFEQDNYNLNKRDQALRSLKNPLAKPLKFGRPESSPIKLLSISREKPKKIMNENFDLREAMKVFGDRASNYLNSMRLEKMKREKLKKKRKMKVRKIQQEAEEIRQQCRKKPFVPKKDFNQSESDEEEFILSKKLNGDFEKEEEIEEQPEEKEYKHVNFPEKKHKKTKITGKPQKLDKVIKNLRKQDLKLYKFPAKAEKNQEMEEDEDQRKAIQAEKKDKNAKFTKVPPADLNKVLDDAKIRRIPKDILQKAVTETKTNDNIIEKSLKDYREERDKKKTKKEEKNQFMGSNEEDEEKVRKMMGFENPIEKFQKELKGDLRKRPEDDPEFNVIEDMDDFPEELLG